jgi:hypothetical protein
VGISGRSVFSAEIIRYATELSKFFSTILAKGYRGIHEVSGQKSPPNPLLWTQGGFEDRIIPKTPFASFHLFGCLLNRAGSAQTRRRSMSHSKPGVLRYLPKACFPAELLKSFATDESRKVFITMLPQMGNIARTGREKVSQNSFFVSRSFQRCTIIF